MALRSVVFATDLLEPLVPLARQAEAAGFHRVWTAELPGRDAVVRALAIGLATERIGVGTGIAYAFTRPPLAMAAEAMDVQRLIGGRFLLGLGTGTSGVRRRYGVDFNPPARRFESYVAELRAAWARISEPGWPAVPPVYGAGMGTTMLRAVARSSDGVLLHPLARARTHLNERVLPALAAGRGSADGAPPGLTAWAMVSIAADEGEARARAKRHVAFYLATPSYKPVLEGSPWLAVADDVQAAYLAAKPKVDWRWMEHLIPDDLVDHVALAGTAKMVAARAVSLEAELEECGVDEIAFQTVGVGLSGDEMAYNCEAIIAALAPSPA